MKKRRDNKGICLRSAGQKMHLGTAAAARSADLLPRGIAEIIRPVTRTLQKISLCKPPDNGGMRSFLVV